MEALHDSQPQDADTGMPGDLDYAAAAAAAGTSSRDGQTGLLPRAAAPAARRDEVQRLFCSVLVVRWDLNTPYAAPVIIMSQEGSNIYQVLERHLRRDYLVGAEKFWRLVRAELGVDTWRPRVQGAQLKALQSARLPESEQEFQNIQLVVEGLQDCLLPESSTDALMSDLRTTISQIQAWWETRNKRPDGARLGGAVAPVLCRAVTSAVAGRTAHQINRTCSSCLLHRLPPTTAGSFAAGLPTAARPPVTAACGCVLGVQATSSGQGPRQQVQASSCSSPANGEVRGTPRDWVSEGG